MDSYDVIIIGAGMSGLSAGLRLTYYGKRVRIFERHRLPGGMNSYYLRSGVAMDTGLHALTNFVPAGQRGAPLNTLLRQLRIRREELDLCPQSFSLIDFPFGTLRLNNDFAAFAAQVGKLFPAQTAGFNALVARIRATDALSPGALRLSARQVVGEYIDSTQLQDMLFCPVMYYGNAQVDDMDFNQFCIIFQSVILEGFARPRHGMRPFLQVLLDRFAAQGGELSLGVGVRAISRRADGRQVVTTDDGASYTASALLSSAGGVETARLCAEAPPPELSAMSPGQQGFTETLCQLNCHPRELGLDACVIFRNTTTSFRFRPPAAGVDPDSHVVCMPGNYVGCEDTDCARLVRLTHLAAPGWWHALSPADYRRAKDELMAQHVAMMDAWKPGFKAALQSCDMFTPKTISRYTGRINGAIYGSSDKLTSGQTSQDGLYLCGTDQGFLGIVGAMLSGVAIVNRYLLA
ncbi:phytoene desaturase family protein [Oligosphaera ethanolica]|uniref:Phytoene dehydrogenase-like protein n=1 Tax=Oligosphaera ethanolica TaxID=760260 RepID=A0AAE3VJ12_9BACT|nr:NAD(P)/FAD-dependent oxidoreductase [Oligosphaera ethanolica]MDQ0291188.1 phytoene dehydrogenase-like protein [Oligosphaera ethanolica]